MGVYAIADAFIRDTDGDRVLSKCRRRESIPSFSKCLASTREREERSRKTDGKRPKEHRGAFATILNLPSIGFVWKLAN